MVSRVPAHNRDGLSPVLAIATAHARYAHILPRGHGSRSRPSATRPHAPSSSHTRSAGHLVAQFARPSFTLLAPRGILPLDAADNYLVCHIWFWIPVCRFRAQRPYAARCHLGLPHWIPFLNLCLRLAPAHALVPRERCAPALLALSPRWFTVPLPLLPRAIASARFGLDARYPVAGHRFAAVYVCWITNARAGFPARLPRTVIVRATRGFPRALWTSAPRALFAPRPHHARSGRCCHIAQVWLRLSLAHSSPSYGWRLPHAPSLRFHRARGSFAFMPVALYMVTVPFHAVRFTSLVWRGRA